MSFSIPQYRCRLVRENTSRYAKPFPCGTATVAARVLKSLMQGLPYEEVHVLYLDGRNRIIGAEKVSQGGMHGAALTSKEVFRGAILAGASAIIIGHNHPSGDPRPSPEDIAITNTLVKAGKTLGLPLLDHIIVTEDNGFRSILEEGIS